MSTAIMRGDARTIPLADESVDLIITSPPYFGLRSYTDGGEHYGGQIGSEATPQEWVAAMVECTREMVRVLKPEGSIFINLGDKYNSAASGQRGTLGYNVRPTDKWVNDPQGRRYPALETFAPKSLLGLPWRYALACTDQLGLILRRDIIWAKPNGLPESVTDRCRSAHEYVFHLVRQPRYYSAVDEIREPQLDPLRSNRHLERMGRAGGVGDSIPDWGRAIREYNPLGKLPGSVWSIPSQPLTVPASVGVDHFAAFPVELPRRIVLGWSPPGVCVACGQGRRPVTLTDLGRFERHTPAYGAGNHGTGGSTLGHRGPSARITGYVCACAQPDAPTRPAIVLDPFAGTGTTLLAAAAYGRHAIGIDRSADYCRLARWRVNDPAERAKAMEVPKPPPVMDGQEPLFVL